MDDLNVIKQHTDLEPLGDNYLKGICPFHKGPDKSFTYSIPGKSFYCFGCYRYGLANHFLESYKLYKEDSSIPDSIHETWKRLMVLMKELVSEGKMDEAKELMKEIKSIRNSLDIPHKNYKD